MVDSGNTKGNILIVDDTPDNLRLLSSTLSDRGYKVRSVINGAMALMGAQAAPPDLIMLDIKMPDMDGYEVCQRLKANEHTREIPVIFISALDEVLDKVKAFTSGGVDYIQKPFQVEEVLARIENQLTIRRLQTQLQAQNYQLQQTQAELMQALEQERSLKQQIEEMAAIEERNRIAREIHDSLGHSLTALNVQLQAAASLLLSDPTQAQSFLTQAQRLGKTAMQEVRQSVRTLRSGEREEPCLEEAIAALAEEFRQVTGITPIIHTHSTEAILPTVSKTVYRLVQEGLTNISKYAEATQVQIQLTTTSNRVYLEIEDNGIGFCLDQATGGFGLRGMQERIAALDGTFNLITESGRGCQIKVEIPLSEVQL
ncbi:response regulator [Oculatella sp. FACHB-28]|uniref:response regulator n=1 Tax=Oculatella sp. FACHB-28 TaxID=2692845 RepID=UPI001682DA4B|nr:response regulator [Oculatella sp. FACHB-28]